MSNTPKDLMIKFLGGEKVDKKIFLEYLDEYSIYEKILSKLNKYMSIEDIRFWNWIVNLNVNDYLNIEPYYLKSLYSEMFVFDYISDYENECSICFDRKLDCKLLCNHYFHKKCIIRLVDKKSYLSYLSR